MTPRTISFTIPFNVVHQPTGTQLGGELSGEWRGMIAGQQPDPWLQAMLQVELMDQLDDLPNVASLLDYPREMFEALEGALANKHGARGEFTDVMLRLSPHTAQALQNLPPPGAAPQAAPTPQLNVEQYASLCVERTLQPANIPQILARFQVAPGAIDQLDAQWRAWLGGDPALNQRFQQAYAQYEAWLRQQQR
jgi:hypothetical protein